MNTRPTASLCGFKTSLQGTSLFVALCAAAIASAVGFAALQEGVWRIPGYTFSGWMTFVTAATMAACGMLERALTRDTKRVGTLTQYAKLSVLTLGGMYFTNWSLMFLNYPTRVIFKSSKLLPTMAVGTCLLGRWYSVLEYLAAAGLVCGIVLFTLGDAEMLPTFHPIGIGLILVGIGLLTIGVRLIRAEGAGPDGDTEMTGNDHVHDSDDDGTSSAAVSAALGWESYEQDTAANTGASKAGAGQLRTPLLTSVMATAEGAPVVSVQPHYLQQKA
jgi:adenosine 3'-phospho 5'-phosphosulfate transporter B3